MGKVLIGSVTGALVFIFFLCSQSNYALNPDKRKTERLDSIQKAAVWKLNNEVIRSLEQKVGDMEKYVNESQKYIDSSQKNLDLWLKYLSFTLAILIGYSIYKGLSTHEKAEKELAEIRRLSNIAKSRLSKLKKVTDLI